MALRRLDAARSNLNPLKCHIAEDKVKLLGHVVSQEGIEMDTEKVAAIDNIPLLTTARQLKTFVQVTYYGS